MAGCLICDRQSELQYECNYCSGTYCTEHRLPENHDCFAVVVHQHLNTEWFNNDTQKRANAVSDGILENIADEIEQTNFSDISRRTSLAPKDMAKKAVHMLQQQSNPDSNDKSYTEYVPEHTVGTSVDPNYESSPDVNPDGSIDT